MTDSRLLEAYFSTEWRIDANGRTIDIGFDRPPPYLHSPLAVITGYNPRSELLESEENERRNRELQRRIDAGGYRWHPAVALGTGTEAEVWTEPGFALIDPDRSWVIDLGQAFEQNAVLWTDVGGPASILVTRDGFCDREAGACLRP